MRVRIIGGIGSGKTYLAKRLSRKFSIPHVCLDDIFWDDNLDNYFDLDPIRMLIGSFLAFGCGTTLDMTYCLGGCFSIYIGHIWRV